MLKNLTFALRIFAAYAVLCVACFLMLRTITGYMVFRDDVQFLAFKQQVVHNVIWKTAFYIHVFSAVIALLAGFTQFSKEILSENPKLHRLIGKIYVANILFINFPAGLVMGVYANGGFFGRTAFLLLDGLWFYFTLKAFTSAKSRRFVDHKNYMIRSYALTFSAITLRTWNLILSNTTDISRDDLYVINSWLGFVPNLMIAEVLIHWIGMISNRNGASKWHRHDKERENKDSEQ
jgi:uncharacterized membrane protein